MGGWLGKHQSQSLGGFKVRRRLGIDGMCSCGGSWASEAALKSPHERHEAFLVVTLWADQGLEGPMQGHSEHSAHTTPSLCMSRRPCQCWSFWLTHLAAKRLASNALQGLKKTINITFVLGIPGQHEGKARMLPVSGCTRGLLHVGKAGPCPTEAILPPLG